jgi:hypothetical protein
MAKTDKQDPRATQALDRLRLRNLAATPSAPQTRAVDLYAKEGQLYWQDEFGVEHAIFEPAYGGAFGHNISQTVIVSVADTYYEVSGLSQCLLNLVEFQSGKDLKVLSSGTYKVTWSLSIRTENNNKEIEGGILVNGTLQENCTAHNEVVNKDKPVCMASGCFLKLNRNDLVTLGVSNHTDTDNVIVEHASVAIHKVS